MPGAFVQPRAFQRFAVHSAIALVLREDGIKLQAASCKLQAASCKLQAASMLAADQTLSNASCHL
ncbi:hypothetical protein DNK01_11320 [Stutzerimonas kirkiae]|nr:hypothetical protein DNK01_11320 [Stutzerimonas kirkiae]